MAKKLKKKIEELCGLAGLDWEARQARALSILNNLEWKQELCNEVQGLSFRDLERALKSIANERQRKDEDDRAERNDKNPRSKSVRGNSANAKLPPPRTLEQILAQVYAPKVLPAEQVSTDWSQYRRADDPREEVFCYPSDDDSEAY